MRSSSTPHVRTFLWPQKPSWTVRLKPHGFYSLSALGSQTLALWGSTLPKASVCPSCLLASITISWTSQLHSRLPTQAALRTGKSEQHLMQGCSGTRLGHRTKATEWGIHLPPTDPWEDRLQDCITDSPQQDLPHRRSFEILRRSISSGPKTHKLDKHQKPPCQPNGF